MARIMVVEDEPITAADLEHKLTSLGHEVVAWTDNAEEAVAQARTLAPDLVLMDIRLRGAMSGVDAARQLRQHSDVPVVFLTAFADQDTVDRACETLPYGYLLKPFTERSIVAAVQVALTRAREEQARAARGRWALVALRSAGEALIAVDEGGAIRFINEHAEALLHVRTSQVLGKDAHAIVRVKDKQSSTQPLELALRERRVSSSSGPAQLLREGREPITISYSAAPVLAARDTKAGAVLIFREAHAPEAAATEAGRNTSWSALSMRLSHEINNPLTYNLGALQLALRELDELRALSSLSGARHDPAAAQREAQLLRIEQLLRHAQEGASRVAGVMRELGSLSLEDEVAPLHPVELLDLAIGLSGVGAKNVRLARQVEPAPIVRGGKWQLARVLAQGLQDLIDAFDGPSTESNTLRLQLGTDYRGWSEIRITASGERAAVAASGLAAASADPLAAAQVVAHYGGELSVDEQPEGRVLTLRLPPMSIAAPEGELSHVSEPCSVRGSVLVIDDEPLIGRVVALSLKQQHEVTTVVSAESALLLLERGDAFDAILCDLTMPGMSGQDFFEKLSATRPDLAQRVLLMTGGATDERSQRFVDQMAGRCIFKPFTTDELLPLLAERVRASSAPPPHALS